MYRWHRVAERQRGELFNPARKKWIRGDHEPTCSQLDQLCEGSVKVTFGACIQDMELQPEGASRCLQLFRVGLNKSGIGWIDNHSHGARRGDQLVQQFQPL